MKQPENNDPYAKIFQDPESFYQSLESVDPIQKKALMQIEEALVHFQVYTALENSPEQAIGYSEVEIASIVDRVKNDEISTDELMGIIEKEPALLATFAQVIKAMAVMEKGKMRRVPGALLNAIKIQKGSLQRIPSMIVRITSDGLHITRSILQGIAAAGDQATPTRGSATEELTGEKMNRSEFYQKIEGLENFNLRYEVIKESENTITLAVVFEGEVIDYRINLRQDGRIVDAKVIPRNEKQVSFDHLYPGTYELEMNGEKSFLTTFVIEGSAGQAN